MSKVNESDDTTLLEEVSKVLNEREQDYGNAHIALQDIANYWNEYLTQRQIIIGAITPKDVAMMMIFFKLVRETNKPKKDNRIDLVGYTVLADLASPV